MNVCPQCQSANPADSRFCSSCGSALPAGSPGDATIPTSDDVSSADTVPTPVSAGGLGSSPASGVVRPPSGSSSVPPSSGVPGDTYAPGTLLGDRYRVIAVLGRGGMGQVYRADDLTLGQSVALKFLPPEFSESAERRQRFHNEVRTAREVAHPNVCRVYDIGEVDGRVFLSMEYVDGEDLASSIRRIGRFPQEKSLEIARQLCAGLGALHDRGVLHRDLKPANVMLDGRGRVRITDFGLSGVAQEVTGAEARAGTPAYMAPEQLAGDRADARSDIYALGLLLYEVFTGKRAFEAETMAELTRMQRESSVTSLSTLVTDLDPAIERVIQRCLDPDPNQRPPSAFAVAAGLPGGDPLAAALAAGEVPSIEMVAAAGETGRVRPIVGIACFVAAVVGVVLYAAYGAPLRSYHWSPMEKAPQVLADRAREIVDTTGWNVAAAESWGYLRNSAALRWVAGRDSSLARWETLRDGHPDAVSFWFRRSPERDSAWDPDRFRHWADPPFTEPGMVRLWMNTRGDLLGFTAIPPQLPSADSTVAATEYTADWETLLRAAGFDPDSLTVVEPEHRPRHFADERVAWVTTDREDPEHELRIEGAASRGRPISLRVIYPWTQVTAEIGEGQDRGDLIFEAVLILIAVAIFGSGVAMAVRNVRLGRGDIQGAKRLSIGVLLVLTVMWAFLGGHSFRPNDMLNSFFRFTGQSLLVAGLFWTAYLALEPYVRKSWPDCIVGWSRLLTGRVRDPLIGRDILAGAVFFFANGALVVGGTLVTNALGHPVPMPAFTSDFAFMGGTALIGSLVSVLVNATFNSMFFILLLLFLQLIARKLWISILLWITIFTVFVGFGTSVSADMRMIGLVSGFLTGVLWLFMLLRFGLLAFMVGFFFQQITAYFPISFGVPSWLTPSLTFGVLLVVGLTGYGLWVALSAPSPRDELLSRERPPSA